MSWLLYDKPGYGRRLEYISLERGEELLAAGLVVKRWGWYVQDFTAADIPPFVVMDAYLTGTPQVGLDLLCVSQFGGAEPITLSFEWLLDGAVIAGATGNVYTPIAADVDGFVSCVVTATNANGEATSTTPEVGPVLAAVQDPPPPPPPGPLPTKPVNTTAPSVSDPTVVGETLVADVGVWEGEPVPSFSFQWRADGQPIQDATDGTLVLTVDMIGAMISCVIVASNSEGSSQRTTTAVGPVVAA